MEIPTLKKNSGISPIWILPIVALLVAGWLLYAGIRDAGIDIRVHFESAEGITAGKTKVMYKGIPFGVVSDIKVDPGLHSVCLTLTVDKRAKRGLVEDSKFWIVKPEISAGRVSGLETMLTGSYIEVQRGTSTVPSREFQGLPEPPPIPETAPGLRVQLKADKLGSIQSGANVYFKNIVVGSIQNYSLQDDKSVLINAFIKPEYSHLVTTATRFWNSSGVTFKGSLSSFKIHMESVASLIYGGISFYTPETLLESPEAQDNHLFTLHEDFDAAAYGLTMTVKMPSSMGLEIGSKVRYRGFEAGEVVDWSFLHNDGFTVTAHVSLHSDAEFILKEDTRFWVVQPEISLTRVANLGTIVKGSYISFSPGEGKFCDDFTVGEPPNKEEILRPGKRFTVVSTDSSSLYKGAPVLYKKVQVGEIAYYELSADGSGVEAAIFIEEKYAHLISPKSVFWKAGGIKVKANLDEISMEVETLASVIAGGIVLDNPDSPGAKRGRQVVDEQTVFTLYDDFQHVVQEVPALHPRGRIVELKAQKPSSYSVGSPVVFNHMEVGEVKGVRLSGDGADIMVDAFVEEKYVHLLRPTSRFYDVGGISVEGSLNGINVRTESLKSIVAGGVAFFNPVDGSQSGTDGAYLLYEDYKAARNIDKTEITLHFSLPDGLKKGVELRYHGITVGKVEDVRFGPEMKGIIATALVDKEVESLFRQDSQLWLVNAKFGVTKTEGLDTIIFGPYIKIRPGQGEPSFDLVALDEPPVMLETRGGLNIVAVTDGLGFLTKNSPVYYRQVAIGKITGYELSPNAQEVWVHLNIKEPYSALVRAKSKFWNASGIGMEGGILSGIEIDVATLEAILDGGICMATPESAKAMGARVDAGHRFKLYDKPKDAWLDWKPKIDLRHE